MPKKHKNKKPKQLDIRIRRVHALFDESVMGLEEGATDIIKALLDQIDWDMVDHDTAKKMFTLLMSDCNDPSFDDGNVLAEKRRDSISYQAEIEHRKIVAKMFAHRGTGTLTFASATELVELWGAQ